jgi:hypothetical protein
VPVPVPAVAWPVLLPVACGASSDDVDEFSSTIDWCSSTDVDVEGVVAVAAPDEETDC